MKPMMIVPPKLFSDEDIKVLRENGLCVVVAKDPSKVKFVDPIPAVSSRTQIENAAIKLSRILMSGRWGNWTNNNYVERGTVCKIWADILVAGTPLDPDGSYEEQAQQLFDRAKRDEIERLARAEAKAEREAKKAAKARNVEAKDKAA